MSEEKKLQEKEITEGQTFTKASKIIKDNPKPDTDKKDSTDQNSE